jgi:hypothetical protein
MFSWLDISLLTDIVPNNSKKKQPIYGCLSMLPVATGKKDSCYQLLAA